MSITDIFPGGVDGQRELSAVEAFLEELPKYGVEAIV